MSRSKGLFAMVTMNDIAVRLGISRATVSYVLNERDTAGSGISLRDETRRRILEMASEMGYRRNDLARAVVTGKNYVLGFLDHHPGAEVSSRILVGAQEEADQSGYLIKQFPFKYGSDYKAPVRRCIEQRLAGILVISFDPGALEHLHEETARFNMPIVLLDDSPLQSWGARVRSDSQQGLKLALEHLYGLGHRDIAFVCAQRGTPMAEIRAAHFRLICQELGLELKEDHLIWTNWDEPDIIESGVRSLLALPHRPTALVCAGDKIAMIAERAARSLGLVLPHDLSLVGFSDLMFAPFADPPLTTVAQPFEEMGRTAVRHLLRTIRDAAENSSSSRPPEDGEPNAGQSKATEPNLTGMTPNSDINQENRSLFQLDIVVPTSLVVRSSTAPVTAQ